MFFVVWSTQPLARLALTAETVYAPLADMTEAERERMRDWIERTHTVTEVRLHASAPSSPSAERITGPQLRDLAGLFGLVAAIPCLTRKGRWLPFARSALDRALTGERITLHTSDPTSGPAGDDSTRRVVPEDPEASSPLLRSLSEGKHFDCDCLSCRPWNY